MKSKMHFFLLFGFLFLFAVGPSTGNNTKSLFRAKCSPCHKLPDPALYSLKEWRIIMNDMQTKYLGKKIAKLSKSEYRNILEFLKSNMQSNKSQENYPQKIFELKCSLCHQLPDLEMFSINQWKVIMGTMQKRLLGSNMKPLKKKEYNAILSYIQKKIAK